MFVCLEDFLQNFARNWHLQMVQLMQVPVPVPESQVPYKYPVLQSCTTECNILRIIYSHTTLSTSEVTTLWHYTNLFIIIVIIIIKIAHIYIK